jgi:hypothetical protein
VGHLVPIWPVLPHDPSRYSSTVRILVKKRPSGWITTLVPIKQEMICMWQMIQKCPFLYPLWQLVEESLLLCQSHVLFNSNKIQNNNGKWHKLNLCSWSELSHAVDLVALARKPFSQWTDLHASTSICPWTAQVSLKKFLDDKLVFHLEILQNIILKVFPYLDDGFVNDLLRSCSRVSVL